MYGVIIVSGDETNNTPRDIIAGNNDQLPPPYPGRDGVYTAAVWNNIEDVPLTFVVGGGETTVGLDGREYFNRRLSESTSYGVFYYTRLQSDTGNVVKYTCIYVCTQCSMQLNFFQVYKSTNYITCFCSLFLHAST